MLQEINAQCNCDVIVVDDCSKDDTAKIARTFGAIVLPQVQSQGAWLATQAGFRYASKNNYEQFITMDADGQHCAGDIQTLLAYAAMHSESDVVVGACVQRGSFARRVAWKLFKRLTGVSIFDLTSGFRLYNKNAVRILTSRQASLLEYQDMGVLLMLRSAGLTIREVPVNMRSREVGISHIFSSWTKVGYYMLVTLFLCLIKAIPEKQTRFLHRLKQGL